MSEQIVIIGGGPAGIEAATTAAQADRPVVLISDGPIGGRAGWHSLLPSKVWLAAGERAAGSALDVPELLEDLAQVKREWNEAAAAELRALGVEIVTGEATFAAPNQIELRDGEGVLQTTFTGTTVIVAVGSVPFFPPELRPDGRRVLAPRFLSHLRELPATMLVIGAGPTGCESAYLFSALGVEVTWIVDQFGVLPQFHPDAGAFLAHALVRQGVRMVEGQLAARLEREEGGVTAVLSDGARYDAEMAFVAIGRKPDWSRLNLSAAGLEVGAEGRYTVDGFGRSSNPKVYLVGDADDNWMIANKALSQGRVAALHAAGRMTAPYDPALIVQPVYTEPQVAQVGEVLPAPDLRTLRLPYSASLKAHLLPQGAGFFSLTYSERDGRVRGAVAAGAHAADILAPVVVALKLGARVSDLAGLYGAYPTLSELPFSAARLAG